MKTILVVDDEPEIRRLVAAMLSRNSYRVLTAGNAEDALRLFEANPDTDLLLADVGALDTSGPTIADKIAALKPDIKVLFMSGSRIGQRYIMEKRYSLIAKPFTMRQLESKVQSILADDVKSMGTGGNRGQPD